MAQLHDPLRRQLKRLIPQATDLQRSTDAVINAINRTTVDSDDVEKDFLEFAEHLMTFLQNVQRVGGYSRELSEMPNVADKLADLALTLDNLDMADSVNYIGLARRLESAQGEDVIKLAIKELSTFPGGQEKIEWIRKALDSIGADL